MSFPFDAAAALVRQFRELNEPVVGLPNIVPVAVLSDYTRRTSSEPIESRGLIGVRIVPGGAQWALAQLFSPTRSAVVDVLQARVTGFAGATLNVGLTALPSFSPVGASPILNLGGIATTALFDQGGAFAPPGAWAVVALPLPQDVVNTYPIVEALRLWIPPNFALLIGCSQIGLPMELTLLFREIIE